MRKKIFIITIPMLPSEGLKMLKYRATDGTAEFESRFPGMAMLHEAIKQNSDVKIITLRTKDTTGNTEKNYGLFKKELAELSKNRSIQLQPDNEIIIPHSEDMDKQRRFLKDLCKCYDSKGDVFAELTYGTKVTSIGIFSSLVFAEKIMNCSIKKIIYGKYAFDGSDRGELFDIKSLYDIAMLMNASACMPRESAKFLLDILCGDEEQ